MKKQMTSTGETERSLECTGIHELIDWQIIQYRQAVTEHRVDLSKAEGRCVAWQEAEHDFNSKDRAVMGDKWRVEHCGLICPFRNKCLTALHFLHQHKIEPLHKAG